jgi:hypothetical protein
LAELLLQYRIGGIIELGRGHAVRGQGQDHDRHVRRIELVIGGVGAQADRQIRARRLDARLHVPRRAVYAAVQPELQHDAGDAEAGLRGHLAEIGNGAEMALQRPGHGGGHGLRAGPRHLGHDLNGGKGDRRQGSHGHAGESQQAGQRDADGEQNGGDRPPDENPAQVHAGRLRHRAASASKAR